MNHRKPAAATCLLLGLGALTGCGGGGGGQPAPLLVALNLPSSSDAATSEYIRQGADLAMKELNRGGGVRVGGGAHPLQLRMYDGASDPQRAARSGWSRTASAPRSAPPTAGLPGSRRSSSPTATPSCRRGARASSGWAS